MTTTERERLRERPIGDLLGDFASETTDLLSKEIELARAEIGIQVKRAGTGAGLFGAAAVVGLLGLGALTACAIVALALVMDAWLAALIVGAALVVVAGILALAGRARVKAGRAAGARAGDRRDEARHRDGAGGRPGRARPDERRR